MFFLSSPVSWLSDNEFMVTFYLFVSVVLLTLLGFFLGVYDKKLETQYAEESYEEDLPEVLRLKEKVRSLVVNSKKFPKESITKFKN